MKIYIQYFYPNMLKTSYSLMVMRQKGRELLEAIKKKQPLAVIKWIIYSGADLNYMEEADSPIGLAAYYGSVETVQYLLEAGALIVRGDADVALIQSMEGFTEYDGDHNHEETVRLIMKKLYSTPYVMNANDVYFRAIQKLRHFCRQKNYRHDIAIILFMDRIRSEVIINYIKKHNTYLSAIPSDIIGYLLPFCIESSPHSAIERYPGWISADGTLRYASTYEMTII